LTVPFIPIVRTALNALRRDGAALALSFVLPIAFFSIFAVIFGGRKDMTPRVAVIVADEDRSAQSQRLVAGLQAEGSLRVMLRPEAQQGVQQMEYTAATAEAAVKAGTASVALIVPKGFGANPVSFGPPRGDAPEIQMLEDTGDAIAPQVVAGLLQKVGMTAMPDALIQQSAKFMDQFTGGLTPAQHDRLEGNIQLLRGLLAAQGGRGASGGASASGGFGGGILPVKTRAVVGENKRNPMVSFYAAAIGVMFLMFTSSGAAGALLDEAESGTLDRVLSSRITMTTLLAGKLAFNMLLAFCQLVMMFLWAWAVFGVDFFGHIPGFTVMGVCTAFTVSAFGILLASLCKTRAQLGSLSTLVILIMSSIGGSMFPRVLMPESMQKAGLFTINAWAIDGFTKVFWRDEPVSALWPQVAVLLAAGIVLFCLARWFARRWEF